MPEQQLRRRAKCDVRVAGRELVQREPRLEQGGHAGASEKAALVGDRAKPVRRRQREQA